MEVVFWSCAVFAAYTYFGYPLAIALIARGKARSLPSSPAGDPPRVSVIVCARNEERNIRSRLADLLAQDYPPERLEVVVVSDGSTDGTATAVAEFRSSPEAAVAKIVLVPLPSPRGKAAALNSAVEAATGDLLVCTDARQRFLREDGSGTGTIRSLIRHFAEPAAGCVSGELLLLDDERSSVGREIGGYWKYDKWIRRNESRVDSVPGVTGAVYAMRRSVFEPLPEDTLLDDVVIPLRAVLAGHRVLFDEEAVAVDRVSSHASQEWRRKVRTLAGNWQLLTIVPGAFNPFRNRIWLQFMSHKICRLLVPFALLGMLGTSWALGGPFYGALAVAQTVFYAAAAAGAVHPPLRRRRAINVPFVFTMLNCAALAGFWYWSSGRCRHAWTPAHGETS